MRLCEKFEYLKQITNDHFSYKTQQMTFSVRVAINSTEFKYFELNVA